MKAFRMHGVGQATFDDVSEPTPAAGDLVLEPVVTGLCSTDVHVLFDGALVDELPITMGHEVVGRVVDARPPGSSDPYADGRAGPRTGDLVCVEPLLPCGACFPCVRGRPNQCLHSNHLGISADGCWAELLTVPARRAVRVADGVEARRAIFVEPLACALHFIDTAGLGPGQAVAVLGTGPAGLLTVQAAAATGATVIASDPHPARRALAEKLGATVTVDPTAVDLGAALADATRGVGPDAVVEIAGHPSAVAQAVDVAPPGSTVVLAGVCGQTHNAIDTNAIVMRELIVRGAVASRWHFARAMDLISSGRIDTGALVSMEEPWDHVDRLLGVAHDDRDVCKILLQH